MPCSSGSVRATDVGGQFASCEIVAREVVIDGARGGPRPRDPPSRAGAPWDPRSHRVPKGSRPWGRGY